MSDAAALFPEALERCVMCGGHFRKRKKKQVTCSQKCARQEWRSRNVERCLDYARQYALDNADKFAEYYRKRKERIPKKPALWFPCERCGKEFEKNSSQRRFCSVECQKQQDLEDPIKRKRRASVGKQWRSRNPGQWEKLNAAFLAREKKLYPWRRLIRSSQGRARLLGITYDLDREWAKKRWTGKCELTGIPFDEECLGHKRRLFFPSIDRIDPDKGYIKDNCRIILWALNVMKSDGTDKDMFRIAEALIRAKV
jgi:hypothetical protein